MPAPAPNVYPLDTTGQSLANRITDEIHTLSAVNFRDYHCIVPDFAPFYAESIQLHYRQNSSSPWLTLNEGQDYYNGFQFVGASKQTALGVYGAVVFNDLSLDGEIRISYNTVGGEWTLDQDKLTNILVDLIYNPRVTSWEQVSGAPAHFPPAAHAWQLDDLVGMSEVVSALEDIEDAILNRDTNSDFLTHLADFNNPHRVSKSQVGLGRVMNYSPATIAETIAGENPELYVTPIGLHAYIQSLGLDASLNYVTLEEVVNKISVNKILTFDLFLLYMKLYGGADTSPIENNTIKPNIIVPGEGGDYSVDQFFTCNTFTDNTPGTINRAISLSGTGTHTIPLGTNTVKITGRGGIGGESVQPYDSVTQNVSGLGSGNFTIPAGGSIMSIRGRGAAGTQSNQAGIYRAADLGVLNNVPAPNPAPGNPSWSFSIISAFATDFRSNGQQATLTFDLVVRKNFTNGNTHTADPVTVTLTLANSNFSGSSLTYTGSFTSVFQDATSLTAIYEVEFERLPGTDIIPGASATVSINGALRTYSGSNTQSQPNIQSNDIAIIPTETNLIEYNSPPGTEVEIIYQDYTANGTWAIKRYYSSKLTNPTTGTSALIEDTTGSVVGLDTQVSGQWLSTRNQVSTVPTISLPGTYDLSVVIGSSNASVRTFEFAFVSGGEPVLVRVVAEFTSNIGQVSAGQPATVNILSNNLVYPGSPDNQTTPQVRTDTILLNTAFSTSVVYDCPAGSSVVLVYNEPNAITSITHTQTLWEVSTSEIFENTAIIYTSETDNGSGVTLTQWKPDEVEDFINNTRYFVRCRWIRSDSTMSDWSDVREFTFIERATYPPRDSEISRFCRNYDLWGIFADGNGGNYERIITSNSAGCGYVVPVGKKAIVATGGQITEVNCYKIHTFRDSGTFTVTDAGTIGGVVEYLIVAGGGPGGYSAGNNSSGTGAGATGGGGGGDVIFGNATITTTSYTITVGAGGVTPNNGGNSSAFNISALGGGRGGGWSGAGPTAGGSGGGAGQASLGTTTVGANSSSGLGNKGGDCTIPTKYVTGGGGGGGGAGGPGQDAQRKGQPSPIHGGNGGTGISSNISGSSAFYGAGGGGGGCNASSTNVNYGGTPTPLGDPGVGGSGVGGNGGNYNNIWPTPGISGSGSGGGGGNGPQRPGAAGGSGIVIIRYRTCVDEVLDLTCIEATGGSTKEIIEGGQRYRVHTFLADGILTINKACGRDKLEYLTVAGGGGGSIDTGGGGGAGDAISGQATVIPGSYQIIVGTGGVPSVNGGNTQIVNISEIAYGGGAGGKLLSDGAGGGCGGGAGGIYPQPTQWTPAKNGGPGQKGNRGGNRGGSSTGRTAGAGGGGMGAAGADVAGDFREGGSGGVGIISTISGEAKYYSGGGGGSGAAGGSGGPGGLGGGGNGGSENGVSGGNGEANTGGGGGAAGGGAAAGSGGSGIVIVRYKIYTTSQTSNRIQASGGTESVITVAGQKYKLHVFNNTSVLNVTNSGSEDQYLEYLIVAGGAGGGGRGGGGGAGGVIPGQLRPTITNYPINIGAGGLGTIQNQRSATNGENSSAFDLVAQGGGAGGNYRNGPGSIGGSGGGCGAADGDIDNSGAAGGAGVRRQGNRGGSNTDGAYSGGGGGGAGAAGGNPTRTGTNSTAGAGGIGLTSDITGESKYYGGGGGGSGIAGSTRGAGGRGGGGDGGAFTGGAGTPNTGGGGGSGGSSAGVWSPGGSGGSGVIIVRYKID
jgi:hypothetical protein